MHTTTDATKLAITRHGVNKSSPTNFHKISTRYLAHIFNRAGMLTPRDHSDPVYSRTSLCTVYTKNCLTCKNYTAIYEIFQDHQVNSRRFPGVVETVRDDSKYINVNHHNNKWWQWECRCKSISSWTGLSQHWTLHHSQQQQQRRAWTTCVERCYSILGKLSIYPN